MSKLKEIKDFKNLELKSDTIYGVVVYKHHDDFPNDFIGRVWNMNEAKPTELFAKAKTYGELVEKITESPYFTINIKRCEDDDPCIVETWL